MWLALGLAHAAWSHVCPLKHDHPHRRVDLRVEVGRRCRDWLFLTRRTRPAGCIHICCRHNCRSQSLLRFAAAARKEQAQLLRRRGLHMAAEDFEAARGRWTWMGQTQSNQRFGRGFGEAPGLHCGAQRLKLCIGAAEGQAREGASSRRWLALPLVGRPRLTMLPGRATTSSA